MTPLTDSQSPTSINWRRHNDPPGLWAKVLTGSVILHVLLLVSLRWFVVRVSTPTANNIDIPIELVEEAPEAASPPTNSAPAQAPNATAETEAPATVSESGDAIAIAPNSTSVPQNSATPESAPSLPITTAPAPNSTVQSPSALPSTPPVQPSPASSAPANTTPATPSPINPTPSAPVPSPVTPPITPPAEPPTTPPESSPVPTPPVPFPNSEPQTPEGTTSTPAGNPESGAAPTLPGTPLPDPSVPTNPGEVAPATGENDASAPIGQVPVASEATPAGFTANILNVSLPGDIPDVPAYAAQPKTNSQQFLADAVSSACLLTPESAHYLGQPVSLRIAVDDQGRVLGDATQVRQSSGSSDYDQLAMCVISGWEFSPAFNRTDNGDSPVFSNLDVNLTINPL